MGKKSRLKKERAIGSRRDPMAVKKPQKANRDHIDTRRGSDLFSRTEENRAIARNKSGKLTDSANMMRVLRYGETTEASELWSRIFDAIGEDGEKATGHLVTMVSENFVSDFVIENGFISSSVARKNEDEFDIEIGFVNDEICRMIREGRTAGVTLRSFLGETATYPNGELVIHNGHEIPLKAVRLWTLNDGVLIGSTEQETFSACCTDFNSGDPLPPEVGVVYKSSPDIDFNDCF